MDVKKKKLIGDFTYNEKNISKPSTLILKTFNRFKTEDTTK